MSDVVVLELVLEVVVSDVDVLELVVDVNVVVLIDGELIVDVVLENEFVTIAAIEIVVLSVVVVVEVSVMVEVLIEMVELMKAVVAVLVNDAELGVETETAIISDNVKFQVSNSIAILFKKLKTSLNQVIQKKNSSESLLNLRNLLENISRSYCKGVFPCEISILYSETKEKL